MDAQGKVRAQWTLLTTAYNSNTAYHSLVGVVIVGKPIAEESSHALANYLFNKKELSLGCPRDEGVKERHGNQSAHKKTQTEVSESSYANRPT